jgi:inner membrane protein
MQILGMSLDPWLVVGLLAFAVAVTLVTNWLAARLWRATTPGTLFGAVLSSAIWIALVSFAGVLTVRYAERLAEPVVAYLLFGLGAFGLSLLRAWLYQRGRGQRRVVDWCCVVHNLTYLLFAMVVYVVVSWLVRQYVEPVLFIPLCIGVLLPDLDSQTSVLGRLLPFVSRPLEARLGHRQAAHSLAATGFVALVTAPLLLVGGLPASYAISLGFFCHLVIDLLSPQGIMLFWPLSHRRYNIRGGLIKIPGCPVERWLAFGLAVVAVVLLVIVDLSPTPPLPGPAPSYEQTLEQYYSMRGRNRVFARIEGSWQATGRRWGGYFEILNAADESYLILDNYTGRIFTAGRSAEDNFYLSSISLVSGDAIRIKQVEVHLAGQRLAEAVPVLYQMQREPGLLYTYVSGDVVLADPVDSALQQDYAQDSLRKMRAHGGGHYRLHYLAASELIGLASVEAQTADLVIFATYVSPATGPTATPLPTLPVASREAP